MILSWQLIFSNCHTDFDQLCAKNLFAFVTNKLA